MEERILYIDIVNGISGDMTIATLLDLGIEQELFLEEIKKIGLDGEFEIEINKKNESGIIGTTVNVITKERIASIAIKHHWRWLGMTWADYGYSEDHSFEGLGYKKKSYYGLSKNGWLGLGTSKVGDISYRYYINSIGRIVEYKD